MKKLIYIILICVGLLYLISPTIIIPITDTGTPPSLSPTDSIGKGIGYWTEDDGRQGF